MTRPRRWSTVRLPAWVDTERIPIIGQVAPPPPLDPMLVDSALRHLSLTVDTGPPAVLISSVTVQPNCK